MHHAGLLFGGQIYSNQNLFHVQAAVGDQRGADLSDRGDGGQSEDREDLLQRESSEGAVCRDQRQAGEVLFKGHFLLLHHQSCHPLCEQSGLCGSGHLRSLRGHRAGHQRGTAFLLFELCQPIYQALQRDLGGGDGAAERAGLRGPDFCPDRRRASGS